MRSSDWRGSHDDAGMVPANEFARARARLVSGRHGVCVTQPFYFGLDLRRVGECFGVGEALAWFVVAPDVIDRHGVRRRLHTTQVMRFQGAHVIQNALELLGKRGGLRLRELESCELRRMLDVEVRLGHGSAQETRSG